MASSLLSTKFYIPPLRAGAVARPRLTEKLRSGMKHPGSIILLSGPAGFGKTTLLSEFVAQINQPTAWLSLDETDNDPNRFWSYLITACQSVMDGIGDTALELLRTAQPLPEDTLPTFLINDLTGQSRPLILVLDDFHTIKNTSINASIQFLLDHLPPNLRLIISTRTDPSWPLSRYRARNQLYEIRAEDLRFSEEEAAEFLNCTMRLNLPTEALAALKERTEGWIAGLQLAALSIQGRSDVGAFIKAFTGSHIYIAEYLVDEVLKQQTDEIQAFLLQSSILEQLNAGLCEAVTGCHDAQNILKSLQQANIFIIPLDDEGHWFRYHQLFSDLLRARLKSSLSKSDIVELHRRAGIWYEQNGMTSEAVEHALASENFTHVVELVEKVALPLILQANVRTVERWLQAIPITFIENSPRINMAYAWMNLLRRMHTQAIPYIDRLRDIFSAPESDHFAPSLTAEWLAIQAELLIAQGRPAESRDLAVRVQEILPEVDTHVRSMIYITLAKAYQQTLDYDRAAEVFQMIVHDARLRGDTTFEVLGASGQAQMVLKQGRLRRTFEIVNECINRLEMSRKKVPFSATLFGELGQVYFQWHQFDMARTNLRRSMEISGKSGYSDPEIYYYIMLSKMSQMEGDLHNSIREMQKASDLAGIIPPAMIKENVISQQVRIDLAVDRPAEAEQRLASEGFRFEESFSYSDFPLDASIMIESGLVYNSALRVLLYNAINRHDLNNLKVGIDLAESIYRREIQCQHLPVALETLLLRSQMFTILGDQDQALADTAKALELAEPEGYISIFLEEGNLISDTLTQLLKNNLIGKVRPEYVRQILAEFPNSPFPQGEPGIHTLAAPQAAEENSGTLSADGVSALVEALTSRELEVLRLIADGDSNQVIADKLFITVSAVKKHAGNIYGKLSVNSRTQAVSLTRKLGLLPPDK